MKNRTYNPARFTTEDTLMFNRRLIQTGKVVSPAPILTEAERELAAYRKNDELDRTILKAAASCEMTMGRRKGLVLAMVERVLSHEKQPVRLPVWDVAC